MTVQVYNFEQLRIAVEESVDDFRRKLADLSLDSTEIDDFLSTILTERQLLLDEVENLKESRKLVINGYIHNHERMTLIFDDFSENVFNDFSIASYRLGMTTGNALTRLMEKISKLEGNEIPKMSTTMLVDDEIPRIKIRNQRYLTVSGKELAETGAKASFQHVEYLEFNDIDERTFKEHIKSISDCAYIKLPSSIPKLLVYAKSRACGYFEFVAE